MNLDKKKILALLTIVTAAAIMSSVVMVAYSANSGEETDSSLTEWSNGMMMPGCGGPRGWGQGRGGGFGFVEVSEEYETNVLNIAQNDTDVQALLSEGYNITGVRSIISSVVEGNGTVTIKATNAIVMLEKDTTGRASVLVDLEQGKVTQIVTLTRTVIDKS